MACRGCEGFLELDLNLGLPGSWREQSKATEAESSGLNYDPEGYSPENMGNPIPQHILGYHVMSLWLWGTA